MAFFLKLGLFFAALVVTLSSNAGTHSCDVIRKEKKSIYVKCKGKKKKHFIWGVVPGDTKIKFLKGRILRPGNSPLEVNIKTEMTLDRVLKKREDNLLEVRYNGSRRSIEIDRYGYKLGDNVKIYQTSKKEIVSKEETDEGERYGMDCVELVKIKPEVSTIGRVLCKGKVDCTFETNEAFLRVLDGVFCSADSSRNCTKNVYECARDESVSIEEVSFDSRGNRPSENINSGVESSY